MPSTEDPFLVTYLYDVNETEDVFPNPDTMIGYGDAYQWDSNMENMMENNILKTDRERNPCTIKLRKFEINTPQRISNVKEFSLRLLQTNLCNLQEDCILLEK